MTEAFLRSIAEFRSRIDRDLLNERQEYIERISPFVHEIIGSDGYFQEALRDLNPNQKRVVVQIFANQFAVEKYGRTSDEEPHTVTTKKGRISKTVDPLIEKYRKELRAVDVQNPDDYFSMFKSTKELIETAAYQDPFIDNLNK